MDAARKLLAEAPRETLVTKLLAARADLARLQRQEKETDQKCAALERLLDAVREVLYLELPGQDPDVLTLANVARERLGAIRREKEIPF